MNMVMITHVTLSCIKCNIKMYLFMTLHYSNNDFIAADLMTAEMMILSFFETVHTHSYFSFFRHYFHFTF